jgi:spoIIIJ-associated protein
MVEKKQLKIIEKITQEVLERLEIKSSFTTEAKEDLIEINFQTENPAILIGWHGETLNSLQLILQLIAYRKLGTWVRILVDTGDYRQRRAEALKRIALSVAQKVKFSGNEQELLPMNASERRIIHLALAQEAGVETESRGEGYDRHVVVKPKNG